MRLKVFAAHRSQSPALLKRIASRISTGLGRFDRAITSVIVNFSDANGPRKGVDKRCAIVATLRGRARLAVVSASSDYHAAFDGAASKLTRAVQRRLARRRRPD